MEAQRRRIVFFTDRSLGKHVPAALDEAGWNVESHYDHFADDTKDPELLEAIGERGWVFLTQDHRLRYRPVEKKALLDHGLRVFCLRRLLASGSPGEDDAPPLHALLAQVAQQRLAGDDAPRSQAV